MAEGREDTIADAIKQQFLFLVSTLVAIRQCIVLEQSKNSLVSLCWTGCRPQNTHWRRPTSDPKAFFWLLAVKPLVGQPEPLQLLGGDHFDVSLDQHHLSTIRDPSLKPSLTCASQKQDNKGIPTLPATSPPQCPLKMTSSLTEEEPSSQYI